MLVSKIAIIVLVLGTLLGLRFYWFYQHALVYKGGEEVSLNTTLQEEPEVNNHGQKFRIKTTENQYLYVTTSAFPNYHYGQVLDVKGTITTADYQGRKLYFFKYPQIKLKQDANDPLSAIAVSIRNHTKILYEQTLPPIPASLLMGMVFGAREQFPPDFWTALQTTGVLHVIAASGMNVSFVSAAMLFTLGKCMHRKLALLYGSLGIVFYLFLVGFEPSIMRASIMGLLAFGASLLGRQHIAFYAALVSAYLMLLVQPNYLFDLGFQLSFGATLSILFVKPFLDENLPDRFPYLKDTLTTTLSAEIGTMPILLSAFGQVGAFSLVVNVLVLWLIPLVMLFGCIAALIGFIVPLFAQGVLFLSLPFLLYFEWIVSLFGKSNWVIHFAFWHWGISIGYYSVLCALIILRKPQQRALSIEESLSLEKY